MKKAGVILRPIRGTFGVLTELFDRAASEVQFSARASTQL
jgi:hypothetical protein